MYDIVLTQADIHRLHRNIKISNISRFPKPDQDFSGWNRTTHSVPACNTVWYDINAADTFQHMGFNTQPCTQTTHLLFLLTFRLLFSSSPYFSPISLHYLCSQHKHDTIITPSRHNMALLLQWHRGLVLLTEASLEPIYHRGISISIYSHSMFCDVSWMCELWSPCGT